jgi:hypothetical protein
MAAFTSSSEDTARMGEQESYIRERTSMNGLVFLKAIYCHHYYRIPITLALVFLVISPILVLAQQIDFANKLAIYSIIFLAVGIAWQFIDGIKASDGKKWLTKL